MDLFLEPGVKRSTTRQLFEQIRDGIETGRLAPGDRLPPSRSVAGLLGISRHTVTTVYGRLSAEGYLDGRAGGGSFVADRRVPPATRTAGLRPMGYRPTGNIAGSVVRPTPVLHDLRIGTPDPGLFPVVEWRRAMSSILRQRPPGYADAAGDVELRCLIARWIGRSRFVTADTEQVIVTAGAQQAIDLVARTMLAPGDVVAVEDPGYRPARQVFEAIGARVVAVPVDAEGVVVEAIPARARLVYATPSHQFPLGVTLSMDRRRALLALADRHDWAIIEDDYDSEYRHVDRPLEPLHRLDRSGRVVYVGTFSKTLSPSLRLGFAVLPNTLVTAVGRVRQAIDWQPPAAFQGALRRLIADGAFDRHLRRTRRVYAARHKVVTELLGDHPGLFEPVRSNAGLHVAAFMATDANDLDVVEAAAQRGVAVEPLSVHRLAAGGRDGVLVGFGAISSEALPRALEELAVAARTSASCAGSV